MSDEIIIDGETYISSKRAAELGKYTQDYVGQLSRSGQIQARRIGGLWYVSADSLVKYAKKAAEYKPEPPINSRAVQELFVSFDGKAYLSASRAAEVTGYSSDYVSQLARAGVIPSRSVGNRWFVERQALTVHKEQKDALLGAVQAESVGIRRPEPAGSTLEHRELISGPLLKYTSDEGDLLPAIRPKPAKPEEKEEQPRYIPVRIGHFERKPGVYIPSPIRNIGVAAKRPLAAARTARYSLKVPAIAVLTIVIMLSLGFLSLKSSSIYTSNIVNGVSQLASVSSPISLLIKYITRLGDALEPYLAPEIIFRRQQ